MGKRNCGECLMNDVEIVELREDGICPRCGADYGPDAKPDYSQPSACEQHSGPMSLEDTEPKK